MNRKKYVIVDLHEDDAFIDELSQFVGRVVTLSENIHNCDEHVGYVGGTVIFDTPFDCYFKEDGSIAHLQDEYFYAVQLQTLEDNLAENGKVFTL